MKDINSNIKIKIYERGIYEGELKNDKQKEKELFIIIMVIYLKGNLRMIKQKEKE